MDWIVQCGVSPERLQKWRERQAVEQKRQEAGVVEERLIYYADFFDLRTIFRKHWGNVFSEPLGDWKTFEVYLTELEKLRDPEAHRRELLPHQKHLLIGIAGEIRNRIVRYRSKKETSEDCFPRIESVRESLGNIWTPVEGRELAFVRTGMTLRPGDELDFVITASDPEDLDLRFGIELMHQPIVWGHESNIHVRILEEHIAQIFVVGIYITSPRNYHAHPHCDDWVEFAYQVLPRRIAS